MTQRSPFRYFKTSSEIIRLAVMLYIRFPLSLRQAVNRSRYVTLEGG
jgi:transposase-like protein